MRLLVWKVRVICNTNVHLTYEENESWQVNFVPMLLTPSVRAHTLLVPRNKFYRPQTCQQYRIGMKQR